MNIKIKRKTLQIVNNFFLFYFANKKNIFSFAAVCYSIKQFYKLKRK